jgi:hypothetical protein
MQAPETAGKTKDRILQELRRADAETQRVMDSLSEAKSNYEAANSTMKLIWNRLRAEGAILPKP